mmetsp:Transcript_15587/g.17321  ORF Transcript_15587/g.17321 Transcript_15587/m.17321 type:complete len:248 (+) Transcript_15587:2-745(+)
MEDTLKRVKDEELYLMRKEIKNGSTLFESATHLLWTGKMKFIGRNYSLIIYILYSYETVAFLKRIQKVQNLKIDQFNTTFFQICILSKRQSKLIPIENTKKGFSLLNDSGILFTFSPYYIKMYKMMTRGVKKVSISGFILKKKHLQNLISHTRNLELLDLIDCKIETLGVKFINTNYKLEKIDLSDCGSICHSDWVNNPEGFYSFLTAVEKCSLKGTLKTIVFFGSEFRNQDIIDRCNHIGIELTFR